MNAAVYLKGPSVCGFYGLFDADFGDPTTPKPYSRITPSKIGSALLPFACPRCESTIDLSDSDVRERHHDAREIDGKTRDNYFCPCCGNRFYMNMNGPQLDEAPADGVAPATVETVTVGDDGMVDVKREKKRRKRKQTTAPTEVVGHLEHYILGTDLLGSC